MIATVIKSSFGAAVAIALGVSAASAVTVVNGSFEQDPGLGAKGLYGATFDSLAAPGGRNWDVFKTLPGWTTVSGAGIEIQTAQTLTSIDAQDRKHYVELDSDPALNSNSAMQQTINFASTGSYLLSFFYSPRDGNALSNTIEYSLFDVLSPLKTVLAGSVTGPRALAPVTSVGVWTQITAKFVITQPGSYNLRFAAGGTENKLGGFVDNVSIAAVPVPAAGFLLIGALGGLVALRRRKTA